MESIFESLENLEVSESCFNSIVRLIKEYVHEDIHSAIDTYAKTDKKGRDALHKKVDVIKGVYKNGHPEERHHGETNNEWGEQKNFDRKLHLDAQGVNKKANLKHEKKSAIKKSIDRFEKNHPWQVKQDEWGYTTGYEYKPKGYWKQNKN